MDSFYSDVIGLRKFADRAEGAIRFFRLSEGYAGHTAVLALFAKETGAEGPSTGPGSSLHHIALSLGWDEQDAVMAWYDQIDQPYHIEHFDWTGWRGVFTKDPEGNTVELVAARPEGSA